MTGLEGRDVDRPILMIRLWPTESNCGACGVRLVNARHGIPVYEDFILPNDWTGEWGGSDACVRCYEAQQLLARPVTTAEFIAALAGGGTDGR